MLFCGARARSGFAGNPYLRCPDVCCARRARAGQAIARTTPHLDRALRRTDARTCQLVEPGRQGRRSHRPLRGPAAQGSAQPACPGTVERAVRTHQSARRGTRDACTAAGAGVDRRSEAALRRHRRAGHVRASGKRPCPCVRVARTVDCRVRRLGRRDIQAVARGQPVFFPGQGPRPGRKRRCGDGGTRRGALAPAAARTPGATGAGQARCATAVLGNAVDRRANARGMAGIRGSFGAGIADFRRRISAFGHDHARTDARRSPKPAVDGRARFSAEPHRPNGVVWATNIRTIWAS